MKTIQKILCLILAFSFLLPIAIIPMSALGESSSRSSSSPEYVLYEEDFNDATEAVTLQAGNNTSGTAKGWIYDKKIDERIRANRKRKNVYLGQSVRRHLPRRRTNLGQLYAGSGFLLHGG